MAKIQTFSKLYPHSLIQIYPSDYIKIIKAHYKNEKNNDFTIEHFTLDELNSKIIPTNEINEKYKKIRNINITGSEYCTLTISLV